MKKILSGIVNEEKTTGEFLSQNMELTEKQIRQAKFRDKGICVNGERRRVTSLLMPGDKVEVTLEDEAMDSPHLIACEKIPEILYEDEDMILLNKPAGIVVHPSHGHYQDTLSNMLVYYFREKGEHVKVRAVGRLDKDTSGIVVFAKNQAAAARLAHQRQTGIFYKEYLAFVNGRPEQKFGVISSKIGKDSDSLMKMKVMRDGSEAVTFYEVLGVRADFSIVKLRIKTGRTHQIRVHMASLGYPLMGDRLYGQTDSRLGRTALHVSKTELKQPFTGQSIAIIADLPEDMRALAGDIWQDRTDMAKFDLFCQMAYNNDMV